MRMLEAWDGDFLVRWAASPHLRKMPEPEPGAFFSWREPVSPEIVGRLLDRRPVRFIRRGPLPCQHGRVGGHLCPHCHPSQKA